MAEQPNKGRKVRRPKLTIIESLTKGLLSDPEEIKEMFTIKEVEGKGRGVFLKAPILKKGSFVLEYEGDFISDEEACMREKIYAQNNEGCYILSFMYKGGKWAIDATRKFDSYTRLLNHSREPNIRFHSPILVELNGKGLPRLAAYALRDIYKGEEIVLDYGVTDKNLPWLKNKKAGYLTDVDDSSSEEETKAQISYALPPNPRNYAQNSRNYSPEARLKFTRLVAGQNSYVMAMKSIGPVERILKVLENVKKKNPKSEDVICVTSDDSSSSRQTNQSSSSSCSEISMCQRAPFPDLPYSEPSSINKVLDWLPAQQQEIQIVDVKSLSATTPLESYFDHVESDNQGLTGHDPVVVIEDSDDDDGLPSRNINFSTAAINPQPVYKKTVRNLAKRDSSDVCVISDDEIPHSSLPTRRPVGFSPPSAQAQVAVIRPYTSTPAGPSHEKTADTPETSISDPNLTEDELKQLKTMFYCYIDSSNLTTSDVTEKISQNWPFFKALINRGVSANQIRFTVQQFFKPKNS